MLRWRTKQTGCNQPPQPVEASTPDTAPPITRPAPDTNMSSLASLKSGIHTKEVLPSSRSCASSYDSWTHPSLDTRRQHFVQSRRAELDAFRTSLTKIERKTSTAYTATPIMLSSRAQQPRIIDTSTISKEDDDTPKAGLPPAKIRARLMNQTQDIPLPRPPPGRATDKLNHSPDITAVPSEVSIAQDTSRGQQNTPGKPSTQSQTSASTGAA